MTNPTDVRLDETTDAGEFLYQQFWHLPEALNRAASAVLYSLNPTPAALAEALGPELAPYSRILNGLGEFGLEFEAMDHRGDFEESTYELAERGLRSAEAFVHAASELRQGTSVR